MQNLGYRRLLESYVMSLLIRGAAMKWEELIVVGMLGLEVCRICNKRFVFYKVSDGIYWLV